MGNSIEADKQTSRGHEGDTGSTKLLMFENGLLGSSAQEIVEISQNNLPASFQVCSSL